MTRILSVFVAFLATAVWVSSTASAKASTSKSARKLQAEAFEDAYLATEFDGAEKKLKKALRLCKKSCSKPLVAELRRDLGLLYMVGFNRKTLGRKQIAKALELDPDVEFDTELMSDSVRRHLLRAGTPETTLVHDQLEEHGVGYPIPLEASTLREDVKGQAWVVYRRADQGRWKEVLMTRTSGRPYRAVIPCSATEREGDIDYFIEFREGDEVLSRNGSSLSPNVVAVFQDGEAMSFAGEDPVESCTADSTVTLEEEGESDPSERRFWIQLGAQQDFAISGGKGICTSTAQDDNGYYCFKQDGEQYIGTPAPGGGGQTGAGLVAATTRVLLGLDYAVSDGLSVGGSVGWGTRGGPAPEGGTAFVPWSGELRLAYWFLGKRALPTEGFGAYGVLAGGLAQVDAKLNTNIEDSVDGAMRVAVWRKFGRQYGSLGLGAFLPLGDNASGGAIRAEVRWMLMFPDQLGSVISPTLAYAYGF